MGLEAGALENATKYPVTRMHFSRNAPFTRFGRKNFYFRIFIIAPRQKGEGGDEERVGAGGNRKKTFV